MEKSLSLGVVIGAALAGSFQRTVSGAQNQFSKLGATMKDLSSQRGLIERFEKDQAELEKSRIALAKVQKEAMKLKLALKKNPEDEGTAKAMEKTRAEAEKLGASLDRKKEKLRQSRAAMEQAGIGVKNFAHEYTRLGQAIEQAGIKRARMEKAMAAKSVAGQRLVELRGQILGLAGAVYGASRMIGDAAGFEYQLRMFGNVADLDDAKLGRIRAQLRGIATDTNNAPGKLLEGLNTLTAKGLDSDRAVASLTAIGRTATASGADINDLAVTAFTLIDAMGLSPEELPKAMDMLAKAGKAGSFELRDMAQYFPMLTAQAKSLGLVGKEGIATLAASLQIAMKGAADPATAANNFQNFLAKLTAPETVQRFSKMGVDIEREMKAAMDAGKNPIEEMVRLINELTGGDKFRMGELFGDMQVINFLNPMLQNLKEFNRIKKDAFSAGGVVDMDFNRTMATSQMQMEQLRISTTQLGEAFARTLLPGVNAVVKPLAAVATWTGNMVDRFPILGKLIGGVVIGLGAYATYVGGAAAATWLWNSALLANPMGLVVGAAIAAVALIIANWEPIVGFFGRVWEGIKKSFAAGIEVVTKIWNMSPIGLLFKAGQKLGAWATSGGSELAPAGGALAMPELAGRGASGSQVTDNRRYDIKVSPSPGMNEQDLAEKVRIELDKRDQQAAKAKRGALYDQ